MQYILPIQSSMIRSVLQRAKSGRSFSSRILRKAEEYASICESEQPTIITFAASWAGPCSILLPKLEKFSDRSGIPLVIVDVDKNTQLATEHHIRALPTTTIIRGNETLTRFTGVKTDTQLDKVFKSLT